MFWSFPVWPVPENMLSGFLPPHGSSYYHYHYHDYSSRVALEVRDSHKDTVLSEIIILLTPATWTRERQGLSSDGGFECRTFYRISCDFKFTRFTFTLEDCFTSKHWTPNVIFHPSFLINIMIRWLCDFRTFVLINLEQVLFSCPNNLMNRVQ